MALRGTGEPKFVYDHGGGGEVTVLLSNIEYLENKPIFKYIEHESEIDLDRKFEKRGQHRLVRFKMHVYKYGMPEPIDMDLVKAKFDEIIAYNKSGDLVSLWLHRDGDQFKQANWATVADDALFILHSYQEIYLKTADYKDGLILEFRSVNPVDPTLGVSGAIQASEIIMEANVGS